jgi:hypothetical protein
LVDGTCWLLALDFDARTWRADVQAVRDTCTRLDLPVYVERSRSGKGAHVWLFFSEPVRAKDAAEAVLFRGEEMIAGALALE